jgi:hypothetical protein
LAENGAATVEAEQRKIEQAAAEAFERIKTGQHWSDWMTLGEGLLLGMREALNTSGVNRPYGKGYQKAWGQWAKTRPWATGLDSGVRAHLIWCTERRAEIEAWLADKHGKLNHPSAVKRRFEAEHKSPEQPGVGQELSSVAKLKTEIVRLEEEKLQRDEEIARMRAEGGSRFTLGPNGSSPEIIAKIVSESESDYRFEKIFQAMVAERNRRKEAHKQALKRQTHTG